MYKFGFGSDNHSGVHPKILHALSDINSGHHPSYGNDTVTKECSLLLQNLFGKNIKSFFVFNGTAANVLAISPFVKSYHSILCSDVSHLAVDECGAPERNLGCKVITVPSLNGKIQAQDLEKYIDRLGDQHFSQVKVISITQPTELGTLYSLDELKEIKQIATNYNLKLHIDGARFIVAAQSLKKTFKELTLDIGVDSLSFGGTKNGLLFGEIVIFFNSENSLDDDFKYIRKQMMQLPSKQRFIAQQFLTLLNENLYKSIADHEIQMAQYLYKKIKDIPQLEIMFPVQANSVFVKIPKEWVKPLKKSHFFYVWDAHQWIMRWMCSFDTQTTTIDDFVKQIELLAYKS